MLPIDNYVQNALYKFKREMKRLDPRATLPSPAGPPSTDGPKVDRPEIVKMLYRAVVDCLCQRNLRKEPTLLKRIIHKRLSQQTASAGSLTRRGVFAKTTLSSSLTNEEKLSRLSVGICIPYRHL